MSPLLASVFQALVKGSKERTNPPFQIFRDLFRLTYSFSNLNQDVLIISNNCSQELNRYNTLIIPVSQISNVNKLCRNFYKTHYRRNYILRNMLSLASSFLPTSPSLSHSFSLILKQKVVDTF